MQLSSHSQGRYYRPELDAVRLVAFVLVFLHHTLPESRNHSLTIDRILGSFSPIFYASVGACRYGLSLFFTLSAFLICELLLREREFAGTIKVKQFYIRRILRIWPLYYFALCLGLIFVFLPGGNRSDINGIGWFAVFLGAWRSSLFGSMNNPVNPLWSISVEEQFYLFAPCAVKYLNRKSLYAFCAVIILLSSIWLFHLSRLSATYIRIWADTLVQFECFAAGILLCLMLHGRMPRIALWQRLVLAAGCYLSWMAACYGLHYRVVRASGGPGSFALMGSYTIAALGSVLLLIAFFGFNPKLLPRWVIYLGRISFGLYVYHMFAIYIAEHLSIELLKLTRVSYFPLSVLLSAGLKLALPFGLTILMAAISYRYLETPFLKMKKRHSVIESQPISIGD